MKYETNFKELAELFNAIAKSEVAIETYNASRAIYEAADNEWYKNGCKRDEADAVLDAYGVQARDAKKAESALKKAAEILNISDKDWAGDWAEHQIIENIKSPYSYGKALYGIKRAATNLVKYVVVE